MPPPLSLVRGWRLLGRDLVDLWGKGSVRNLMANSWPHTHHTDRRLGVLGGHAELVSKDAGIGLVEFGVGRRFKSRLTYTFGEIGDQPVIFRTL